MIQDELKTREATGKRPLRWNFIRDNGEDDGAPILGDPVLIRRLFKNAFDNAAKHADSSIRVGISSLVDSGSVKIENDGLGISDQAIADFGVRRKQRILPDDVPGEAPDVSLGLGSVIMKTILELHGGKFVIRRMEGTGTQLTLFLPRVN
jgi:signal transduction histidine kinase